MSGIQVNVRGLDHFAFTPFQTDLNQKGLIAQLQAPNIKWHFVTKILKGIPAASALKSQAFEMMQAVNMTGEVEPSDQKEESPAHLATMKAASTKKDKTNREVAQKAMERNLLKALQEHIDDIDIRDITKNLRKKYVTSEELIRILTDNKTPETLSISYSEQTNRGKSRTSNEDAHFLQSIYIQEKKIGQLLGVLDGHAGAEVANFVKERFPRIFNEELLNKDHNVLIAFEVAFARMQETIRQEMPNTRAGCTALIAYIDNTSNLMYTATLGDSEAFACRNIRQIWKLIPLSPVRNWKSVKDATRASGGGQTLLYDASDAKKGPVEIDADHIIGNDILDAKYLRIMKDLNVSRSFGDLHHYYEGRGVIQKCKVSVFPLKPDDRVVLVCDGVTDYLPVPLKLNELMSQWPDPFSLAYMLIEAARQKMSRQDGDNVTVIAFTVKKESAHFSPNATPQGQLTLEHKT